MLRYDWLKSIWTACPQRQERNTFERVSSTCTPWCLISNNSVNIYILNTLHQLHVLTVNYIKLHAGYPFITSNNISIKENNYNTKNEFQFCCLDSMSLFLNRGRLCQGEYCNDCRQWNTNCHHRRQPATP